MANRIEILPVYGIGDIQPGDDLAAIIANAAPWLRRGDVLVVTSKIVSKSEGQLVAIPPTGAQRDAAREAILSEQTARVVARRGNTTIVQTHHGFVMAAAGIDSSNVDRKYLVLLPKDPDASARALRAALRERFGLEVAVVISDTMGRPWRNGLTDVALGVAGLEPIRDYRGVVDPYGNELHITQMAVADELCSAAELVKGKCEQMPVAVVRGYQPPDAGPADDGPGTSALIRDTASDLFSLGTAEARAEGLTQAAGLTDATAFAAGPVDLAAIERVLAAHPRLRGRLLATLPSLPNLPELTQATDEDNAIAAVALDPASPAGIDDQVSLGERLHALRCAFAAAGFATIRHRSADGTELLLIGLATGLLQRP